MNKSFLFVILVLGFNISYSQTSNIPDPNFDQVLLDLNLDNTLPSVELDVVISSNIAASVTDLDVLHTNISDLIDMEGFMSTTLWEGQDTNALTVENIVSLENAIKLVPNPPSHQNYYKSLPAFKRY